MEDAAPKKSAVPWKLVLVVLVVGLAGGLAWYLELGSYIKTGIDGAVGWIEELGAIGPLVFILLYAVLTVLLVPGSALTIAAGLLFGVVMGSLYVSAASMLGATASFLIGRYFARGWVSSKIEKNEKFKAVDEAVGKEGWKIVGLTRLSPVFPFVFLNYAYGLTRVKLRDYFFASWVCMMPGTVMYVYAGYLAAEAARLAGGASTGEAATQAEVPETGKNILLIAGFVATVVVTVYVTRIAKRALAKKVGDEETEGTLSTPGA